MRNDYTHAARTAAWRLVAAAALVAALVISGGAGAESGPTPDDGGIAGAVAPRHGISETATPAALRAAARDKTGTSLNVTWHGGPVMHSNTTYAIYWSAPSSPFPAGYESAVNQYFADVAHDSGGTQNVYSIDPQYTDSSSRAAYDSTFGGSWDDTTNPLPNDCGNQYSSTGLTLSSCLLDSDLRDEVKRAIAANHWPSGMSSLFFVFTPATVGTCTDVKGRDCAYRTFCAFHSDFSDAGQNVIYADIPFPVNGPLGSCGTGVSPNGNDGDSAINLISHEHNESITDPLLNAWYDSGGREVADKCAWNFGNPVGGSDTGAWNQVINGDHYYVQREWNNASGSCVQRVGDAPATPIVNGVSPLSGPPGTVVTISGTNLGGATAVKFGSSKAAFTVVDDGTLTATVPANASTAVVSVVTPLGTVKSPSAFTVTAAPIDFSLALAPAAAQSVTAGQNATFTVTLTRVTGFTGAVTLSVLSAPDVTAPPVVTFTPKTIGSGSTTATVTFKSKRQTTPGTYTVTVSGAYGDVTRSATATVTVLPSSSTK